MKAITNQGVVCCVGYGSFFLFLLCLGCMYCLVSLFLVVSISAINCLEILVSEMTNYVLSEMLNPTHSLSSKGW